MTNKRGGRLLEEIWYAFYDYNLTLTLLRSTQTLSYNTAQKKCMRFCLKLEYREDISHEHFERIK